eukprot:Skav234816  [mRNA]  locus=scaffold69:817875:819508:- [translate_table: standard]
MVRQRCWFFPCTSCFWLVIGILVFFAIVFSLLPALSAEPDLRLTAPIFQPGRSFNATYLAPGQLAGTTDMFAAEMCKKKRSCVFNEL